MKIRAATTTGFDHKPIFDHSVGRHDVGGHDSVVMAPYTGEPAVKISQSRSTIGRFQYRMERRPGHHCARPSRSPAWSSTALSDPGEVSYPHAVVRLFRLQQRITFPIVCTLRHAVSCIVYVPHAAPADLKKHGISAPRRWGEPSVFEVAACPTAPSRPDCRVCGAATPARRSGRTQVVPPRASVSGAIRQAAPGPDQLVM